MHFVFIQSIEIKKYEKKLELCYFFISAHFDWCYNLSVNS